MSSALEPTTPGWYKYDGGADVIIFLLDRSGQWFVIADNGDSSKCDWNYIEQALGVFGLRRIGNPEVMSRHPVETPHSYIQTDSGTHNVFNHEDKAGVGPSVQASDAIRGKRR